MFSDFDWFFTEPFLARTHYPRIDPEPHYHTYGLSAHEAENGVEVELEVPRFRADDIKVTADVDLGVVKVEGSRPNPRHAADASHTYASVPAFSRSFSLSTQVFDLARLTSGVQDGVLTIFVPRRPQEAPRIRDSAAPATSIAIAGTPSATVTAQPAGREGQVSVQQQAPQRGQWPPKLQVAERPTPGVATSYTYSLPANVKPGDVRLQVTETGALRVDVSYKTRRENDHGFEESSGSFTRFVPLPAGTKAEQVTARFENDQLKVDVKEAPK